MEYYLKDDSCGKCNGRIIVIPYEDVETGEAVVSHGLCERCMKGVVLPGENFKRFVMQNCYTEDDFRDKVLKALGASK